MEEQTVAPPKLYAWYVDLESGPTVILFAHGTSKTEAAEKITLRFAASHQSPDLLLKVEMALRLSQPYEFDFREGVGMFQIGPDASPKPL